jgi:hypothetical protein
MRSTGREIGEENQPHQREHPSEDANQQPEVRPAQLKQSVSAWTTGRRSPLSLMGQTVYAHIAPRRYTPSQSDTGLLLMFPGPGCGQGRVAEWVRDVSPRAGFLTECGSPAATAHERLNQLDPSCRRPACSRCQVDRSASNCWSTARCSSDSTACGLAFRTLAMASDAENPFEIQ